MADEKEKVIPQTEIDDLLKKAGDAVQNAVTVKLDAMKAAGEVITKAAVEDLIKNAPKSDVEMEGIKATVETLKKESEKAANEIKSLKENPTKVDKAPLSFKEAFVEGYKSIKKDLDELKANPDKQKHTITLEVKAVNITDATTIGAGSTQISLTDNTGIISPIRKHTEKYLSGASIGSTSGNKAMWIEETTETGTPIFIAEADPKTQLSVLYVEQTMDVRKIAVYGKVSTEFLADLPQLLSYVETNLMKRVGIKIEDGLLLGAGTGVTLKGINAYATAFSAGGQAGLIEKANYIDVVNTIVTQVKLAYGIANRLYIHPDDMAVLKATKDSVGRPLWKDYMNNDGDVVIGGCLLVETTAMTAGSFVGGDCTVAHVLFRDSMSLQIGLDGNDFTNNLKTILLEQRLCQFVSANDTPCLVKGTWAAAVAALLAP